MEIEINKDKLLIKNTTKEEREKIIKSNLILSSGNQGISNDDMDILNEYIEGKIELYEAIEKSLKKYKEEGEK